MKKWTKIWAIIAAATLVLGVTLFVIGMSVLKWDFTALDTLTYTEVTKSAQDAGMENGDQIKSFVYKSDNWDTKITKGDEFSIKYYTTEITKKAEVKFDRTTGELSFEYEDEWNWGIVGFRGIKKLWLSVDIVLPENVNLTLHSTNLNMSIAGMDIGDVEVIGTNADVKLSDLAAGNLNISGTNATFEMTNCTAGDISADATNGTVNFKNVTGGKVNCTGTNMSFSANECEFESLKADGTNGDIYVSSSSVARALSFTGTNISVYYATTDRLKDFASISVSGTNSSCKINNQRYSEGYTSPTGSITFEVKGTNSSARIFTKTD